VKLAPLQPSQVLVEARGDVRGVPRVLRPQPAARRIQINLNLRVILQVAVLLLLLYQVRHCVPPFLPHLYLPSGTLFSRDISALLCFSAGFRAFVLLLCTALQLVLEANVHCLLGTLAELVLFLYSP